MKGVIVRAGIRAAQKSDFFGPREKLKKNTLVFIRDNEKFLKLEMLRGDESLFTVVPALMNGNYYVLCARSEEDMADFRIKLTLRPAGEMQLCESTGAFRTNMIYYLKRNDVFVDGPFRITEDADEILLREMMERNEVFTVYPKQSFEEIQEKLKTAV